MPEVTNCAFLFKKKGAIFGHDGYNIHYYDIFLLLEENSVPNPIGSFVESFTLNYLISKYTRDIVKLQIPSPLK